MAEYDDDVIEEISDEEKLKIAQYFLISSPPNQFNEVLTDVRKLLPSGLLSESIASGIARVYNTRTSKIVTTPANNKVALSGYNEVNPTKYYDPIADSLFDVDHLTLITNESDGSYPHNDSLELYRAAIQNDLTNYVTNNFSTELAAGSAFTKDNAIAIIVTGEKPNLRNYWSGKWTSTWSVIVSGSTATITGEIKVHAHYFEDGNVQLQTTKPIAAASISFTSESDLAVAIINRIKDSEQALFDGLGEMYLNMNEETFRAMRRVMPITRTKMEWNVNSVRMVKQVRK
eukprot:gene19792-25734_t